MSRSWCIIRIYLWVSVNSQRGRLALYHARVGVDVSVSTCSVHFRFESTPDPSQSRARIELSATNKFGNNKTGEAQRFLYRYSEVSSESWTTDFDIWFNWFSVYRGRHWTFEPIEPLSPYRAYYNCDYINYKQGDKLTSLITFNLSSWIELKCVSHILSNSKQRAG